MKESDLKKYGMTKLESEYGELPYEYLEEKVKRSEESEAAKKAKAEFLKRVEAIKAKRSKK